MQRRPHGRESNPARCRKQQFLQAGKVALLLAVPFSLHCSEAIPSGAREVRPFPAYQFRTSQSGSS